MVTEGEQSVSLDLLRQKMADFAKERDWGQFHSPRNLLLALVLLSHPKAPPLCGCKVPREILRNSASDEPTHRAKKPRKIFFPLSGRYNKNPSLSYVACLHTRFICKKFFIRLTFEIGS